MEEYFGEVLVHACTLSHLLLVIPGGRTVTLMEIMVCSCSVASQTGTLSLSFNGGLSLCLGSQCSCMMEEANLGGAANMFYFP